MTNFQPLRFGKYLLLDRVAIGGMAELYRAKITGEKGFEKLIAIKKILPHLTVQKDLIDSFVDEARLAALLQHQNIIQIYDFGKFEDSYFIAMEYLSGKDLRFTLEKSIDQKLPINLQNSLHIISQACAGLDYAHKLKDFHGKPLNIIHRDIGPHNIFITYSGQVKVIDFGIAKAASNNTTTQAGAIKGKLAYMSPEQASSEIIDHRSDIFSMGIVFYEMITQKRMFDGDTLQIFSKVRNAVFEPAININKTLPEPVYKILDLSLAKNPEDRYQSADQMLIDISRLFSTLSLQPSDRNLAVYMKKLFKDEAETEEILLREAALVDLRGTAVEEINNIEQIDKTMRDIEQIDKTKRIIKGGLNSPKKIQWFHYSVFLLLLIVSVSIIFNQYHESNITKKILPELYKKYIQSENFNPDITDHKVQAVLNTCKELIKIKQFNDAEKLLKSIINKNPSINKNPFIENRTKPVYSDILSGQALRILKTDSKKAKLLLLKSVDLNPENAEAYYLLGRLYTNIGDDVNAIESYKKAVAIDPQMAKVFFNLGNIYAGNKKYDKSQEMYLNAIALSPSFLDEVLTNLAYVQKKTDRTEESIKNLEKACKINPENIRAKKLLKTLKRN